MKRRWILACTIGGVVLGMLLAPATGRVAPWTVYNPTPSMPIGRYVHIPMTRPAVGSVVVIGNPGHGFRWLMKEVRATAGMRYCWNEQLGTHTIDGHPMPPPLADAARFGLQPWRGCQLLKDGDVVGYGQTPDSFDSRYEQIGIVHTSQLWGVYKQVKLW